MEDAESRVIAIAGSFVSDELKFEPADFVFAYRGTGDDGLHQVEAIHRGDVHAETDEGVVGAGSGLSRLLSIDLRDGRVVEALAFQ